jgi:hypothetical protein
MSKLFLLSLFVFTIYSQACSNIPSDHVYYLTDFCGPATTACGKHCGNCTWSYAADSQRFGCGSVLNCVRNGKSMNLDVIDYGPACSLETKSGKPIIDASISACQYFTGGKSCGWSDKFAVTCKKISSSNMAHLLAKGPCTWNLAEASSDLPYCHIPEMSTFYNFDNIDEWISHETMLQSE